MATAKKPPAKKPAAPANLALWNKVCVTDPSFTKKADTRGGFTSINATWQAWQATELWGPYGKGWGVRNVKYRMLGPIEKPFGICLEAEFFCPESTFEIATDMPYAPNNDCFKKLLTDLTTKALSKLGFSADVFFGLYDDNRYVAQAKDTYIQHRAGQTTADPPPPAEPPPQTPVAVPPPAEAESGAFTNSYNFVGLEAAVVGRLMLDEKELLKKFMPTVKLQNEARTVLVDLVKLRMSEDGGLGVNEQISYTLAEQFYAHVKGFILDQIAARE
jgi:hypothetical protein